MFDRNLTQETIRQQLEPVISVFTEEVIPDQVALLRSNTYAQNYAWMYSFEKRLKYRIEDLLGYKLRYHEERVLFGSGGVLSEGLSNAFAHGHRKDTAKIIEVWSVVAQRGLGFSISDQGPGFEFDAVFNSFKSKQSFFHVAGNGFTHFDKSQAFSVSYQNNGRQLCILCLFETMHQAT